MKPLNRDEVKNIIEVYVEYNGKKYHKGISFDEWDEDKVRDWGEICSHAVTRVVSKDIGVRDEFGLKSWPDYEENKKKCLGEINGNS